jgi:aspartate/methionine/tyrosine aminotransferase
MPDHFGVAIDPERVIVTAGSSAALLLVMALLVNRDDQILLADPWLSVHSTLCPRGRRRPRWGLRSVRRRTTSSRPTLISDHWTPRTRGVLIASPSIPTGTEVPGDEMGRIAATVARLGGRLIVDEIYLGLSYALGAGVRPQSALTLAGEHADELFVISSFSKYFNMTGWRLGWIIAPERHLRDLEKLAQNLYISPPTVSQRAALACFPARDIGDSGGA